ncbi:carboxypeptidase B-like [Amphiura filiformis]|uniref:carboxypeptidase B-like n=1 Tax=Amphiura filiformis TaxID=82378 RepID=UPI003B2143A3
MSYKVLRIVPRDAEQLDKIRTFYDDFSNTIQFWKEPSGVDRPLDIMISPELLEDVKVEIAKQGLTFTTNIEDVQTLIEKERCKDCVKTSAGFDYNVYHTIEEINQWVTDFTAQQSLATEVIVGQSYGGLDIMAVKISSGGNKKRIIHLQGGSQPHHWITPAMLMYMANMLATMYTTDTTIQAMVDNYDWHIVPVVNPDGYEMTWTTDRLWGKNWQPHSTQVCWGTQLKYNYAYQWGGYGGSPLPCDQRFFGEGPLSSVELNDLHRWVNKMSNIAAFIDFQSYGQVLYYPWAYLFNEDDAPQPDKGVQDDLGRRALNALQVPYGTVYGLGHSILEAGVSEDYAYGTLGVKYPYRIEVRDQGEYGYLLPESLIDDTAIETFEALKVIGTDPLA